jgi:hypothetical protein
MIKKSPASSSSTQVPATASGTTSAHPPDKEVKPRKKKHLCPELLVFRNLLEKLSGVNQEDFTWTWDHETYTFLIQADNHIINRYVDILRQVMGEALCLHLERVSIIVDLRPWKTNPNKTSLRIGFEGSHLPPELHGHTSLEDIVNLHYVLRPDDPPEVEKALKSFQLACVRIDLLLDRKFEWMWERHWRADGLAFAVVRAYTWINKHLLVEREVDLFNQSASLKNNDCKMVLSTYNRGTSFNVRIALDGLPNNVRTDTRALEVFDTHFSQ